ncbi:MAG: hypothetical protein MJ124_02215 [Lachnospiraceae bacterium]|nr:hypothetical protein [Lachnospiraceae bacterium]
MKKNILAIAILAAVLANIILTAVLVFSVVPAAKKNAYLVERICAIVDLELENPEANAFKEVPLSARDPKLMGENLTINLTKETPEEKTPFAVCTFTIVFNSESDAYKDASAVIDNQKAVLNNYVVTKVGQYTKSELIANKAAIEKDVLSYCRSYFGSQDLVVEVVLAFIVQ